MKDCDIVKHMHERLPNTECHINLPCWRIPFAQRKDRHCGEHTQNIRSCIETGRIRSILKTCHEKAHVLWESGRNNIKVWCICDGHRHASVSVAAILQHVYQQRGYNSKGPFHIDPVPRECWNCTECRKNVEKETVMAVVAADFILL